jgi:hypothetical protein
MINRNKTFQQQVAGTATAIWNIGPNYFEISTA